ncbi:MAG: metal-sulfur cluster assembly factor [Chloroflexota bacterium]|nr:metal-sulfur cluster assembly factor [Chloroflexota bacterium]
MVTEQKIREALGKVMDPHIGISVVDMGMIRGVLIDEGQVEVRMVLTAPGCPLAGYLVEQVRQATEGVAEVEKATVTVLDERWRPEWMARSK